MVTVYKNGIFLIYSEFCFSTIIDRQQDILSVIILKNIDNSDRKQIAIQISLIWWNKSDAAIRHF
jgi:hypothetical protein